MNRRARILVPGDPSAVVFARKRILLHIRAWNVPLKGGIKDAIELVASELITNAVVHVGGFITVVLSYTEGRLLLVVHDGSGAQPRPRNTSLDDNGGRGLALVEQLATRYGWEHADYGKRVWAEFDVPMPRLRERAMLLRCRLRRMPTPRSFELRGPYSRTRRTRQPEREGQ